MVANLVSLASASIVGKSEFGPEPDSAVRVARLLDLVPEPLVAIQQHFIRNFPYATELSDVVIEARPTEIVVHGTVRSHYLRQITLNFAVAAVNNAFRITDQIRVVETQVEESIVGNIH